MNTETTKHFRGACRYKDGTKVIMEVSKVNDFQEARSALLDQPNCTAALVLVPKIEAVLELESA